jgi:K+-sensing histidine kinase KdpD
MYWSRMQERGMTESRLGRFFQPFDRLGAESAQISGTGLGPALTKALVERLGRAMSRLVRLSETSVVGSWTAAKQPALTER